MSRFEEFGTNSGLVEELYAQYTANPRSVNDEWRVFFAASDASDGDGRADVSRAPALPPTPTPRAPALPPVDAHEHDDGTDERVEVLRGAAVRVVENMEASLRFYVGQLDFKNADWGSGDFTYLSRDDAGIYLSQGDQGRGGAWVWMGVDDVRKLQGELTARGVTIRHPPRNYPWALEMQVEDPDGNVIRFGSDPD